MEWKEHTTMVFVSTVQPSLNQELQYSQKNFKWKNAKKRPILYEK